MKSRIIKSILIISILASIGVVAPAQSATAMNGTNDYLAGCSGNITRSYTSSTRQMTVRVSVANSACSVSMALKYSYPPVFRVISTVGAQWPAGTRAGSVAVAVTPKPPSFFVGVQLSVRADVMVCAGPFGCQMRYYYFYQNI